MGTPLSRGAEAREGVIVTFDDPATANDYGFNDEPVAPHASRTMLLADLRTLLAACPTDATATDYRAAIVEENALMKATTANRRETFQRLCQFYALDPDVALFRVLRTLWDAEEAGQPLLALLCVAARDPVFRVTADLVLSAPSGEPILPRAVEETVRTAFPDRYGAKTLKSIGQHILGSWQQGGHLAGTMVKRRAKAHATPAATAYALLLGYLRGARGIALFATPWAHILDAAPAELDGLAFAASQRGWLDYRRMGGVAQIDFPTLLGASEVAHGER
jgi:hypothetical protein